ncbi:AAA family ATPase [Hahella sp. NBU794]|uniref:AAA family ATPase n=1 Tax=Hahella sp. NBU794 TaxID=3422590 RepID=UPI003D6ED697
MSKQFSFPFYNTILTHESGVTLTLPGNMTEIAWLNAPSAHVARQFQKRAQSKLLKQGEYVELLHYLPEGETEVREVKIKAPASREGGYTGHEITFEAVIWRLRQGEILGVVPALAVACLCWDEEQIMQRVSECIQLEMLRNKRFDSARSLIACQWYAPPKVVREEVTLEFYTPAELADLRRQQDEPMIAKTARRMHRSRASVFGLDAYVDTLNRNLLGEFRQSVLVVGPSGCGKTALINEFVKRHFTGVNANKIPWRTTAAQMLQALTQQGGWRHALGLWVREARANGELIYLGNLSELFEVGQYQGNSVSIAEALRDPLTRNEITLIAEVTEEQLAAIDLRAPGYSQLFHIVRFTERSEEEENQIARQAIQSQAELFNIRIAPNAIERIILLQRRYAPYSGYPGKIIRFFENMILAAHKDSSAITENEAIAAFCEESGMPRFLVDHQARLDADKAREHFRRRIVGQTQAVEALVRAIITVKAGLAPRGKPIASLLFVGPTGVGKTEMAKTLAQFMFGDEKRLLRFDMSEYSDPYSVTRLTATGEASLVTKVRQQPFSVLLFDEIEKADPAFYDLLLQVLGEGRLTDDHGESANFCSALIIMTSNLGAQQFMQNSVGFSTEDKTDAAAQRHFEQTAAKYFRPELFNRIDQVAPFFALTQEEQMVVLQKEMRRLQGAAGLSNRQVSLNFEAPVWSHLNNLPSDPRYGARSVQRLLRKHVTAHLAPALSARPHEDPLEITATVSADALSFDARVTHQEKRARGYFMELTEKVAAHRRDLQALQESPTWISCLSELDQMDARKRRKRNSFWEDPEQTRRYGELFNLREALAQRIEEAYALENECLSQLLDQQSAMRAEDYEETLRELRTRFDDFLIEIESTLNPHYNRHLLFVYGGQPQLDRLSLWYERWFEKLDHDYTRVWIYLDPDLEANPRTEGVCRGDDIFEIVTLPPYKVSKEMLTQEELPLIGMGWALSGACAQHFWRHDHGKVDWATEEDKNAPMYIDFNDARLDEYKVPTGIHRMKFYKDMKAHRKVREEEYQDERFGDPQTYQDLSGHSERVKHKAARSLQEKLLARLVIRQEKKPEDKKRGAKSAYDDAAGGLQE